MKGNYGQFCGVARALELVGERWALLIVRDLVVGPKRFTEVRRTFILGGPFGGLRAALTADAAALNAVSGVGEATAVRLADFLRRAPAATMGH